MSGRRSYSRLPAALRALYSERHALLAAEARRAGSARGRARVGAALPALLPGAPPPLRAVAERAVRRRVHKWVAEHWPGAEILCEDVEQEMSTLLAVGDAPPAPPPPLPLGEEFCALQSPAHAIIALKEQICLLLEDEDTSPVEVLKSCANICSPNNVFTRPPALRAILQLSVDFCIVYISRKTSQITDLYCHLHAIWNTCCPERRSSQELEEETRPELAAGDEDRAPTPHSDEEEAKATTIEYQKPEKTEKTEKVEKAEKPDSNGLLEYFDRILCPRNILLLTESRERQSEVWEALAGFLVFLMRNSYLTEDSLTEQCLAVYRQDWSQNILESLSTCMKSVSSKCLNSSTGKFNLFLDFLADYCNDMDYDLVE